MPGNTWSIRAHGRRAGLARHAIAMIQWATGMLDPFGRVEWERVDRLVFVCRGNICRSPYGEAVARARGLAVTSFGLEADPGVAAHGPAERVAAERGVVLGAHRARARAQVALGPGDLVLTFEPWQARALRRSTAGTGAQVALTGLLIRPRRPHVEDPYGLSDEYFRECFAAIEAAVAAAHKCMTLAGSLVDNGTLRGVQRART
jgi:protein-tyrosine phosphatase